MQAPIKLTLPMIHQTMPSLQQSKQSPIDTPDAPPAMGKIVNVVPRPLFCVPPVAPVAVPAMTERKHAGAREADDVIVMLFPAKREARGLLNMNLYRKPAESCTAGRLTFITTVPAAAAVD